MLVNPFATRYVSPGRIDWVGTAATAPEVLVARFYGPCRRRAAIVGPHGSGKSTLLEHLSPLLGSGVVRVNLRRNGRPFQRAIETRKHWSSQGILVIDGFEQLSPTAQWLIRLLTRFRRLGLLVTTHHRNSLPLLIETCSTVEVLQSVMQCAFRNAGVTGFDAFVDRVNVSSLLEQEKGNIREVLMRLYDEFSRANASKQSIS